MSFVINIICGAIIGIANIIPGVSGGTMAVMLNIYDKLISSVTDLRKNFKKSILFLIPLVIGAGIGIIAFSKLLEYLLDSHPMPTFLFFTGLIAGSLPLVFRKASETKFKPVSLIPFVIFFAVMVVLTFVNVDADVSRESSAVLEINVLNWFYLFFGSILAAMCMIIPGVSGSMILMIIGLYPTVLISISHLTKSPADSISVLIPVGLGVIIGILGGAKLIDICIKKFPQMTFFGIMGLMTGSLISLFKNSGFVFNIEGYISIAVLLAGFGISILFGSKRFANFIDSKKTVKLKKSHK